MKTTIIIVYLLLSSFFSFSQIKGIYNLKIIGSKNVTITAEKGSKITLTDTKTIVIREKRKNKNIPRVNILVNSKDTINKFYVVGYTQEKDSSGLYVTVIKFNNIGRSEVHDVSVKIYFDKPFETCDWSLGSVIFGYEWGYTVDKMSAYVKAGTVFVNRASSVTIKSKERIFTNIVGTYGALN